MEAGYVTGVTGNLCSFSKTRQTKIILDRTSREAMKLHYTAEAEIHCISAERRGRDETRAIVDGLNVDFYANREWSVRYRPGVRKAQLLQSGAIAAVGDRHSSTTSPHFPPEHAAVPPRF
jgi:hypothetical protein